MACSTNIKYKLRGIREKIMPFLLAIVIATPTTLIFINTFSEPVYAEGTDYPYIELIDENENKISKPLLGNSKIYFDTITHSDGTVIYSAKSNVQIDSMPASLSVISPNGSFHISVKALFLIT